MWLDGCSPYNRHDKSFYGEAGLAIERQRAAPDRDDSREFNLGINFGWGLVRVSIVWLDGCSPSNRH